MALCEKKIKGCIALDCANPIYAGMESTAYLFNKSDVTLTYEEIDEQKNPNMVTEITLGSGVVGYRIDQFGRTPYTGSNTSMAEGNSFNKFNQTFNFVVSDNSEKASREILDNLANGKFIAVVQNQYKGSDGRSEFQVYGANKGLAAVSIDNDKYSEETDGGWAVSLTEENTPVAAVCLEHKIGTVVDTLEYLQGLAPECV